MSMTPDEISFTNAFHRNRPTLAGFAKCSSKDELHVVRDAFVMGMASDLCPEEYEAVRVAVVTDPAVASSVGKATGLASMVTAARTAEEWETLVESVHGAAAAVGSNLDEIWSTLETGRLEWLGAVSSAHKIKCLLKEGLQKDRQHANGDVSDAKMIWIYALSLSIPQLKETSEAWRNAVKMEDGNNPMKGYDAKLWDSRRDEWKPLDLGLQAAADKGGSSIQEAWDV